MDIFLKGHRNDYFPNIGKVTSFEKWKPGRPGKGNPPEIVYTLEMKYSTDEKAIQRAKERLSFFILITNLGEEHTGAYFKGVQGAK